MYKLTYTECLTILCLPSLEYRRFRGDLIEVYKITNNMTMYDPITTNSLFKFAYDSSLLLRPEYTSMLVYFFPFIFHPARVLFGSAR